MLIHVIHDIHKPANARNSHFPAKKLDFSIGKSCAIIGAVREGMHMADILLKRDSTLAATYVPNTFIDEYMIHADGEFVKIYLYLLRCMDNPDTVFSISDIADKFDHTEKDVTRALKYWEKMHLLRLEFNSQKELTGICLSDLAESKAVCGNAERPAVPAPDAAAEPEPAYLHNAAGAAPLDTPHNAADSGALSCRQPVPGRTEYTKRQLLQFSEDETVKELLFIAERYLGHTLNHTEIQTILYWLDKLGFSQDMIEYLMEYCIAKNHPSIRYMDKVAISWAEAGIRTLAAAKQDSGIHNQTVYTVQKAFGISSRSLAEAEIAFVKKWSEDMGFSDEIISLACQKTILSIHQISFEYADTILESWKQQNAHTLNDIRLLDAQYQEAKAKKYAAGKTGAVRTAKGTLANGFANFTQRSYNYDELERELLSGVR